MWESQLFTVLGLRSTACKSSWNVLVHSSLNLRRQQKTIKLNMQWRHLHSSSSSNLQATQSGLTIWTLIFILCMYLSGFSIHLCNKQCFSLYYTFIAFKQCFPVIIHLLHLLHLGNVFPSLNIFSWSEYFSFPARPSWNVFRNVNILPCLTFVTVDRLDSCLGLRPAGGLVGL